MAKNFSYFTNFKSFLSHDPTHPMYGNIEDEDLNPQEESRPIVSDASASSSTINEANKKTDSSSSSNKTGEISKRKLSPYEKPWNPNNFRQPDDDAMFSNIEDREGSRPGFYMPVSSSARKPETGYKPSEENLIGDQFPRNQMMDPQQQLTRPNLGSPSFSSNPNAVPCDPHNAFHHRSMEVYIPYWDRNIFPRSSSVQAPMPSQMQNPVQAPMPFHPMQNPVRYPYQRPMANQENQYQHPMANMSELNRQQVLQHEPQSTEQKPKGTQESDPESSSQSGRDQEEPK